MTSTVFELSIRVMILTLTIAIATLPTYADQKLFNAVTSCRLGKEKLIVKTILTSSPYDESKKAASSKYDVKVRNHIGVKHLSDGMKTVTSESTRTAVHCSFEDTTAKDLSALLDAGEGALVTLVAGETRLMAHRAILAARSPAFAAMLCHGSQIASSEQVHIPDMEGPVLRQLLAYLYTLQVPQLPSMATQLPGMARQLLAAADKFGLSALKSHCEVQVAAQLTVETAAATAVLAIRHSSTSLRQAAIPFIKAHLVQVMATRGWADAAHYQPDDMNEVYQLLSESPVETSQQNVSLGSTLATGDSQPTTEAHSSQGQTSATTADSQPTTEAHSSQGQTSATTADSQPTTEAQSSQDQTSATTEDRQTTIEAQSSQGQTSATTADSHPTTEDQSSLGQTAATTASPAPPCLTPPPDDDSISHLRSLSSEEKGERLREAAKEGRVGDVEALLAAGADVGAGDEENNTALHEAAIYGHVEVARRLLGCGAELGSRESSLQFTPLHDAAYYGHTAVARLLLAASAGPNARDYYGWTPLHRAASEGHAETVAVLLEWGADRGARDDDGETPLDKASEQQVIVLLT